jgi:hypothetical protein
MFITTNNNKNISKESQNFLFGRLNTLGFDIAKDEVFSSLGAARDLIQKRQLRPLLMLEPEALEVKHFRGQQIISSVLNELASQGKNSSSSQANETCY